MMKKAKYKMKKSTKEFLRYARFLGVLNPFLNPKATRLAYDEWRRMKRNRFWRRLKNWLTPRKKRIECGDYLSIIRHLIKQRLLK